MFWITLGIGITLGLGMAIIICALVMDKFVPLAMAGRRRW